MIDVQNITPIEKEILTYLIRDHLTVKKIALLRNTSVQAVYKIINKLKKKGLISGNQLKGFKNQGYTLKPISTSKQMIRLHGVSFKIKILTSSTFYEKLRQVKNVEYLDNNTLRLFKNTILVDINKDFLSSDPTRSSAMLFNYFNRFLIMLENRLNVIVIRDRYTTIKLLRWHFAEINNELAKDYNQNKTQLKIFSKEDGKLWFTIDNSFNLNEAETQHPETAEEDMIKVKEVFNQYRDIPNLCTPLELQEAIMGVTKNQVVFAENMVSHVKAIQKLGDQVEKLGTIMTKLAQTRLGDFK